jgi:hypothetical protein
MEGRFHHYCARKYVRMLTTERLHDAIATAIVQRKFGGGAGEGR